MKISTWIGRLRRVFRPRPGGRDPAPRTRSCRLSVEGLEERLVPAFNVTVGTAATANVLHDAAGHFTATATGATVAVSDIRADLLAGKSVTVSDGSTGSEAGDITWQPGADLDFSGIGAVDLALTLAVDPSATGGSVTLGSKIFDSNAATPDALDVSVSATRDLTVNGTISTGVGSITLAADTRPDGTGDDGAGALTVGAGAVVNGGAVTLRGADVHIDTSANPATVTASAQSVTVGSGYSGPEDLVFDGQGNLFVTNQAGNSITKVTPSGQVSTTVFSADIGPNALTIDGQNDLFFTAIKEGNVFELTPQGTVVTIATGFSQPSGIAIDKTGALYIANSSTGVISKIARGQTTTFASGFSNPAGIAFDAAGNLYVNNVGSGTISKVSPDGQTVTPFAGGFNAPSRLVFDTAGNLWVTDSGNGAVKVVTPQGQVSTALTGLNNPHGIRFDANGDLFVTSFSGNTVTRNSTGVLTLRSSLPTLPLGIGGADNAVPGVNLTDAELARLNAGSFVFGDPGQTGDLAFTTASLGSPVTVQQSVMGGGKVVLDDGNGAGPALGVFGNLGIKAGAGGIVALNPSNAGSEIASTGAVTLDTFGPVGSAANRIQLAPSGTPLTVGAFEPPADAFLDGLGTLTLGNVTVAGQGTLDVTARGDLTVGLLANVTATTISLAADTRPDGTGDDGVGTLSIGPVAKVTGNRVTLRGAAVNIETSNDAATITANPLTTTFVPGLSQASSLALDAQGNLYVANTGNAVIRVTPQGTASVFATGFSSADGLAFDAQGNLYVANFTAGTVSKVTPQGLVSTFASGFNSPAGLAFDAQGNLYVAVYGDSTVDRVTPLGQASVFASGFRNPRGLAFFQGNLYVANVNGNTVSKVSPDGQTVTTYASGFAGPYALAFDAQGNLFVSNLQGTTVSKVTPAGVVSTAAGGFSFPTGVTVDAQGNLIVITLNGATISKVTPDGQASTLYEGLSVPVGLALDPQGDLFISNRFPGTVSEVTPDGQHITTFATGFNIPEGVAFFQGNLYIANGDAGTVSKVTPQGQVSTFASGFNGPFGLAFDAAGNLYVSNQFAGTVSRVTPQGQVSTFASNLGIPTWLAFDALGNLYVTDSLGRKVDRVTPQGQVSTFASGFANPQSLAFDAQGNLYVADGGNGTISRVTPDGQTVTTVAQLLAAPQGLAFDAQGNLLVVKPDGTVSKVTLGSLTVRASLPTLPITLGGAGKAAQGVSLTAEEVARLFASDHLTFGDPAQAGDITLTSVTTASELVQVLQSPAGPGTINFDESAGDGLTTGKGSALFVSGTGGIHEINVPSTGTVAVVGTGVASFGGGGDVGTQARPLSVQISRLGAGSLAGTLFLTDGSLTTVGEITAAGIVLNLDGDFVSRPGTLHAAFTDITFFSGAGPDHLDAGGQTIRNLTVGANVQLVNNPLTVGGALTVPGTLDPNGLSVTVLSVTTVEGTYLADIASQVFLGGLVVSGQFQGGGGSVTAGGVTLNTNGELVAPTDLLIDTADWTNHGGTFDANGGTVLLAGLHQTLRGSTTFHNLSKTVTAADTLTFQAGTTQTVTGTLTLQGAPGSLLALRSTTLGTAWKLDPQGGRLVFAVDVQDSANVNGTPITPNGAHDSGGNSGWRFASVSGFALTTAANTRLAFSAADFAAHYSNPAGSPLAVVSFVTLPLHGLLTLNGIPLAAGQQVAAGDLGALAYLPAANYSGADSFTWAGSDGIALTAAATVNLTVTPAPLAPPPPPVAVQPTVTLTGAANNRSTVGVFDPFTATWYLRDSNSPGAPDIQPFRYGAPFWVGVVGDWDGNGTTTVGVVDLSTETWYLRNENSAGAPDYTPFRFGAPGWVPVVGDWGGAGHTGIGVYDPTTGTFYLRSEVGPGFADAGIIRYGAPGWAPVVGDWDGNGTTTIGVFDPFTATWYLKNSNMQGAPDITPFAYGLPGWKPVVGDWNGDGTTTVGVVNPAGTWFLRNENGPGAPDAGFFAYGAASWEDLAGAWAGPGRPLRLAGGGLPSGTGAAPLTASQLGGILSAALARLQADGLSAALVSQLAATPFQVGQLGGGVLAEATPGRVVFDATADGVGWFVDPTPAQDEEFPGGVGVGDAAGHVDLLTAALQELGQEAGLTADALTAPLAVGVRHTQALDALFAAARR